MMLSQVRICVRSLQYCCNEGGGAFYVEMLEFVEYIAVCLKAIYYLLAINQGVIEIVSD